MAKEQFMYFLLGTVVDELKLLIDCFRSHSVTHEPWRYLHGDAALRLRIGWLLEIVERSFVKSEPAPLPGLEATRRLLLQKALDQAHSARENQKKSESEKQTGFTQFHTSKLNLGIALDANGVMLVVL
jgi:hypothetical protein